MNEFKEKLIKKLYESVKRKGCPDEACWEHLNKNCDYCDFKEIKVQDAISIVNQLAEEYKHCTLCYLQSPCEYQNENAILPASELADDNGWIPVEQRLPETNESVLCWAKSTARGGDVCFVGSCHNGFWFLQSSADTHSFPGQYVIVAWQPLPPKFEPKGE